MTFFYVFICIPFLFSCIYYYWNSNGILYSFVFSFFSSTALFIIAIWYSSILYDIEKSIFVWCSSNINMFLSFSLYTISASLFWNILFIKLLLYFSNSSSLNFLFSILFINFVTSFLLSNSVLNILSCSCSITYSAFSSSTLDMLSLL